MEVAEGLGQEATGRAVLRVDKQLKELEPELVDVGRRERKKALKGEGKECKELVYQLWLLTTPKKCNWQVRPRRSSGTFQFES